MLPSPKNILKDDEKKRPESADFHFSISPSLKLKSPHNECLTLNTETPYYPPFDDLKTHFMPPTEFTIKDNTSQVGPIGLLSFGFSGLLVNLSQAGVFPQTSVIVLVGLIFGTLGQLITGLMEWRKNSMIGAVINITMGCFSFIGGMTTVTTQMGILPPPEPIGLGFFMFLFGSILFVMFLATLSAPFLMNLCLCTGFLSFWIQSIALWKGENIFFAYVLGTLCCSTAIYNAYAEILNTTYKRTILPMGFGDLRKKKEKQNNIEMQSQNVKHFNL